VGERSRFIVGILKISVHTSNDEFVKSSTEKRFGKGLVLASHFGDGDAAIPPPSRRKLSQSITSAIREALEQGGAIPVCDGL
jgi:hypothetical protein